MINILYVMAIILILFWVIGFFMLSLGAIIHIMLVLAVVSVFLRIISGNKITR